MEGLDQAVVLCIALNCCIDIVGVLKLGPVMLEVAEVFQEVAQLLAGLIDFPGSEVCIIAACQFCLTCLECCVVALCEKLNNFISKRVYGAFC